MAWVLAQGLVHPLNLIDPSIRHGVAPVESRTSSANATAESSVRLSCPVSSTDRFLFSWPLLNTLNGNVGHVSLLKP